MLGLTTVIVYPVSSPPSRFAFPRPAAPVIGLALVATSAKPTFGALRDPSKLVLVRGLVGPASTMRSSLCCFRAPPLMPGSARMGSKRWPRGQDPMS